MASQQKQAMCGEPRQLLQVFISEQAQQMGAHAENLPLQNAVLVPVGYRLAPLERCFAVELFPILGHIALLVQLIFYTISVAIVKDGENPGSRSFRGWRIILYLFSTGLVL